MCSWDLTRLAQIRLSFVSLFLFILFILDVSYQDKLRTSKTIKLTLFLGTSILKTFLKIINLGSIAGRHVAKEVELSAGYFSQKEQIKFRSKKKFLKTYWNEKFEVESHFHAVIVSLKKRYVSRRVINVKIF